MEENNQDDDKKFAVKLNLSGYKPDEIKVQLRGQELTVTVRHEQSARGPIKIATITLNQYKSENISLDVHAEKIILHGQHRSVDENGFENSQFKKVIKIPDGVDQWHQQRVQMEELWYSRESNEWKKPIKTTTNKLQSS